MVCPLCYKIYKQKDNYAFHMLAVHNVGDVSYSTSCPTCGKADFRSLSSLKAHRLKCRVKQRG